MFNPISIINSVLFLPVILFAVIMKGLALWKSARQDQVGWFVVLLFLQTLGILEIIYLVGFQKNGGGESKSPIDITPSAH